MGIDRDAHLYYGVHETVQGIWGRSLVSEEHGVDDAIHGDWFKDTVVRYGYIVESRINAYSNQDAPTPLTDDMLERFAAPPEQIAEWNARLLAAMKKRGIDPAGATVPGWYLAASYG